VKGDGSWLNSNWVGFIPGSGKTSSLLLMSPAGYSNRSQRDPMEETIDSPHQIYPTIFVVEEDNNARPSLTRNLRQFGYRLLVVANVQDALEWLSAGGYIHADLLLIDLEGKLPEEVLTIGRGLRAKAQYHEHTPLVVMPESFTNDEEGTDKNVSANDWICYYQDADQLQRLLARLLE
jgi:DNA-binding NtrC family response regulator